MNVYIAQNVSNMGADGYRVTRIVMMQWDPKKYLEMLRRNPQLKREEYPFPARPRHADERDWHVSSRSVNIHQRKEVGRGGNADGRTPNIGVILNFNPAEGRFISDDRKRAGT